MNTNSSNIVFTCDVCGRTVQGITFMNGMKFCVKCYQETFGKTEVVVSWAKDNPFEELKQENKTKDERIAELEREVEELKANQTPTRKRLLPKNWDKYNLADKLRYRNSQVKEALIRLSDMNEMETMLTFQLQHLRHEICEKIRERVVNGGFRSTIKEFADVIYEKYKNWVFDILDQIEGGK